MAAVASAPPPTAPAMDNETATSYLTSLLNMTLRVHITDGRMFVGRLRCTDKERNIVLATTFEHRPPSAAELQRAATRATGTSVTLAMTRRFVGLVVVPGAHITRIEID